MLTNINKNTLDDRIPHYIVTSNFRPDDLIPHYILPSNFSLDDLFPDYILQGFFTLDDPISHYMLPAHFRLDDPIPHYILQSNFTDKHLDLPGLSAAIFVCAENVVKMRVFFCIMANFMLYIGTLGTCASPLHIIIIIIIIIIILVVIIIIIITIKPLLKIFNECRSLTGVGELNPY